MGYVLFWLEAAITTVLFIALVGAWIARRRRKGLRVVLWIVMGLLVLFPWGGLITIFSAVYANGKMGLIQIWMTSVCFGLIILIGIILARRGRRRLPAAAEATEGLPAHRTWRLGRLALAFAAALLVTAMTYWNLSLAVEQRMAQARAEAAATMQSVWPAPVPASMNAEPLYRQAYEMLDAQDTAESKWSDTTSYLYDDHFNQLIVKRPATQPIGPALVKFGPALSLVGQGAAMPVYNANVEFKGISTLLPPFIKYRALCRLLGLAALQAARDGHADQAMDDLTSSFNMAGHMGQEPFVITSMVSAAMDALTVMELQNILAIAPPTAESLDHLHISAGSAGYTCFQSGLKFEYGNFIITISSPEEFLHTVQNNGSGLSLPPLAHLGARPTGNPYYMFVWPEEVEASQRYFQTLISLSDLPYAEWRPRAESLEKGFADTPGFLAKMLMPTLIRGRIQAIRAEAQHRLAYIAKAMWLYRLKNGQFPEKLGLLAPDFLPVLPKDPFTDKDMLIGHTAGGKAFIYSVGPDLKDDGGLVEVGQDKKDRDHGDIVFYLEGGRPLPASQPATAPGGG